MKLGVQKLTRSGLNAVWERDFWKPNLPFFRLLKILYLRGEICLQNAHFYKQKGLGQFFHSWWKKKGKNPKNDPWGFPKNFLNISGPLRVSVRTHQKLHPHFAKIFGRRILRNTLSGLKSYPRTRGVSLRSLRDNIRKQGKNSAILSRKGIAAYRGVSRIGPLRPLVAGCPWMNQELSGGPNPL